MNESALNALINLFAIFSIKGDLDYETGQKNLEEYLIQRLGIRETGEYISLFFELYELYSISPQLLSEEKTHNLIHQVCNQLKGKIPRAEQLVGFLHFLELASGKLMDVDEKMYQQLGQIFEIPEKEYETCKEFIFCQKPAEIQQDGFLLINNQEHAPSEKLLHIQNASLQGELLVYYLSEIRQFVFRYFGNDALLMDGNSVRKGQFYTLNQGSIIRGQFKTSVYYSDISLKYFNYQRKNPIRFSADHLSYFFPGTRHGIQEFSFSEESGQMIAVMGGSGVGKSTLLNVLNGTLVPNEGSITINEFDIHRDFHAIEGLIGYIPQDDLVIGELTVFQNVYHNARLCLDHLSEKEIEDRVNHLLMDLDLYEIRDMVVGSPLKKTLSGGQRKRLNIALELIREPSILFVDEPTSGLSSRDSERIMVLLKQQAHQGCLVIVNIHQPSSFIYKLFDKLWIMDKGGYPVYAGNPLDAIIYFKDLANHIDSDSCECPSCGNVNPEQVLEIIETRKIDHSGKLTEERKFTVQELYQRYKSRIQDQLQKPPAVGKSELELNFHKPGWFKQFKIFSIRNLQSKLSNKQYVLINLLQAPLLALVVSFLTRYAGDEGYFFGLNKNFPSFLFMSVVVMLFQGMSLSAEEIIRDKAILQRESFLRLSRFSYINSKVAFLFGVSAVQSLLFVLTSFLVLDINGLLLQYWLILFLTALFANMAGLNISAGLNSVVTIYISIPLLIIPQILLCGLIVPFEDLQSKNAKHNYVPVIGDLMVSRWAFEALAVNQFTKNEYTLHYFDVEKEMAEYFVKGELIIPELTTLSQALRYDVGIGMRNEIVNRRIRLLEKETRELDADGYRDPFPGKWWTADQFSPEVSDSLQNHLKGLREIYKQLYRSAEAYKDQSTNELISEMGQENLLALKKSQYNSALGTVLLRDKNPDMIELGTRAVQVKVVPIYRNPESRLGRAHFYAPYKTIGSLRIPTLNFNALVIVLMTLLLYVSLYYNWLANILKVWEKLQFRIKR